MVLLADSMLTLRRETGRSTATRYDSAEKLVALSREPFPAAALVVGPANIGQRLVSDLLMIAGDRLDKRLGNEDLHDPKVPVDHDSVVAEIHGVIDDEWRAALVNYRSNAAGRQRDWIADLAKQNELRAIEGLPCIEEVQPRHFIIRDACDNEEEAFIELPVTRLLIVIATYINNTPKLTEMAWPGDDESLEINGTRGLRWWGSGSAAVSRLLLGFDHPRLRLLANRSIEDRKMRRRAYVTEQFAEAVREQFMMPVPLDWLPLETAIEFTEFLGTVARGYDHFSMGEPAIGGPLDILVLQSDRRHWIKKKTIQSTVTQRAIAEAEPGAEERSQVKKEFYAVYGIKDDARGKGLAFERVLNKIFALDGLLVRDAFTLRGNKGEGVVEQIDGVIELDHHLYLVEAKWQSNNLGPGDVAQHMMRVAHRGEVRGLYIVEPGFTHAAIALARDELQRKVIVLGLIRELYELFETGGSISNWLREKVRRAQLDREPHHLTVKLRS